MQYNVSQLLKSPTGAWREYDVEPEQRLRLDSETPATVTGGHVRFDRTNTSVLVRGHVDAVVTLACARCLDPAPTTVGVDLAEEYQPAVDIMSGQPLPRPEDEMVFRISQNHVLDLTEAVRQNLIGSLPLQPLCRPECAGICPRCGVNRNEASCNCVIADANHPFAALADLLKEAT